MSKPTPGPWSAKNWRVCAGVDCAAKFKWICDTATNKDSRNELNAANAQLIAAAPDLLTACQEAVRLYEQGCVDRGYKDEPNWIDGVRDMLDAAILKATSEKP